MSRFDLEKLLAEANADLDAEARARLTEALNAAVEATGREATLRASQATQAALEGFRAQLEALEAESLAQATKGAQGVTEAYRKALGQLEMHSQRAEEDATGAVKVMAFEANKARGVEIRTREAAQDASRAATLAGQRIEQAQNEIDTLQGVQRRTDGLLKKARTLVIAGAVLAVFGIISASWGGAQIGQRSAQNARAEEFVRLDQVALDYETRIAELAEQENAALIEVQDMADLRDQIGTDLNNLREVQDELGIELIRRDGREIELRMGDATITRELRRQRTTVGLGDVRLRARSNSPGTLVILENGLTLAKTSIGSAAHGQEVWWTRTPD